MTTTNQLARANVDLDAIRQRLLALDTDDVREGLKAATMIPGLGTAGASGLLALMYPAKFGTVDQFAVKALRQVSGLPEAGALAKMNPVGLTVSDGVRIIGVLRRKAAELGGAWTPRQLDMVLWVAGR